jgi:hypothetical protein
MGSLSSTGQFVSAAMKPRPSLILICLFATGSVSLITGCWGESQGSVQRRLQEAAAANAKAAAVPDPDSGVPAPPPAGEVKAGPAADPDAGKTPPPKVIAVKNSPPSPPSKGLKTNEERVARVSVTPLFTPSAPLSANASLEERRARSIENLGKLGQALNTYSDKNEGYPATKRVGDSEYPPMSWRVAILPLLGYEKLYVEYRPDQPWDSETNKKVLSQIPPEFQSPERRDLKTNYLVPLAEFAAFGGARGRLMRNTIEDPLGSTLIIVEADDSQAVEWTRPDDLLVQDVSGASLRSKLGSLREDGFFAVLASGNVCRVKPDATEPELTALFTVDGEDTHKTKGVILVASPSPAVTRVASTPPASVSGGNAPAGSAGTAPEKGISSSPAGPATTANPSQTSAPPNQKLPVPSEAELTAARATIKKLYADEYKKAKTVKERRDLAQKLEDGSREAGADHVAEYEFLRISRDMYAQNGQLAQALKANSQLEKRFQINIPEMRLETVKLFQKSPEGLTNNTELITESKLLLALAVGHNNFDVALEALDIGRRAAKRGNDTKFLEKAAGQQSWLEAARVIYKEVPKAEARLAADSSDSQASQTVGIYECVVQGRWDLGLPQLAKAADLKLRFLARLDLSASKSPQEIFDLADQYWDLAEQRPNLEEQGLKLRAAYWYTAAAKQLPSGLQKIKSRKRLAEIIAAYGKEETEKIVGRSDITATGRTEGEE